MNKYLVKISRNYCTEIEVIAESEEQAEEKANNMVDHYELYGTELYDDYNGSVELIEEAVEIENE